MLTVHIWNFRGKDVAWGHASMTVEGGSPSGSIYISWWPQSQNRQRVVTSKHAQAAGHIAGYGVGGMIGAGLAGPGLGRGIEGATSQLYCVAPIGQRTYEHDVSDEGQPPDHQIDIDGLDETQIKQWWKKLIASEDAQWCTLGPNCSTTVARALDAGGAEKYARIWHSWNLVWKPDDVLRYARAVRDALNKKSASSTSRVPQGASSK